MCKTINQTVRTQFEPIELAITNQEVEHKMNTKCNEPKKKKKVVQTEQQKKIKFSNLLETIDGNTFKLIQKISRYLISPMTFCGKRKFDLSQTS
ncbi:hypothetical protein BLOT_014387 [Blomia tropicalis]|nr:hypothetical protein BLOT_014387 [Blomia tropicalis]